MMWTRMRAQFINGPPAPDRDANHRNIYRTNFQNRYTMVDNYRGILYLLQFF